MTRLDRIIGFDSETGVISVEAGVQIGDLARLFAPRGWIPPVIPGTGFATVGGCIANDVHGKNHHVVGSFGQHVVEMVLIQNNRKKTVTPTRPADLFRATVGGLGQTGIIASAKIQMMPSKGDMMVLTERQLPGHLLRRLDRRDGEGRQSWPRHSGRRRDNFRHLADPKANRAKCPLTRRTGPCQRRIVRLFNEVYFGAYILKTIGLILILGNVPQREAKRSCRNFEN